MLRSLSRPLLLLRWNKYGAKKMSGKPHSIRLDSTLANQGAGKTIEKPLKELRWNQPIVKAGVILDVGVGTRDQP